MIIKPLKKEDIIVVDSIMGSGKTSWAIQYINQSRINKKFIFITPYLTEINRIIESTKRQLPLSMFIGITNR